MIDKLRCQHCGWVWYPRNNKKPVKCPNVKCQKQDWEGVINIVTKEPEQPKQEPVTEIKPAVNFE